MTKSTDDDYDYETVMADAPEDAVHQIINFDYPGPVAAAFARSDHFVRAIMGPQGSAKTSSAFFEPLTRAIRMPYMKNGERHLKFLCLRDTYSNLYKTAIPSWWEWFPPKTGVWKGGQDRRASHEVTFKDDYGVIRVFAEFAAIGDANVEQFFKGFAVTLVFGNEGDGLVKEFLQYAMGRVGRFPRRADLKDPDIPFYRGVFLDLNAPDTDHWIYKKFVEDLAGEVGEDESIAIAELKDKVGYKEDRLYAFFKQPSGLSPDAENIQNLPPGYYAQMMGNDDWWIRRNVKNEWGYSRDGEPVYRDEWVDSFHVAEHELLPVPGLPLQLGIDSGGHPAAMFRQTMPNGQKRRLREITCQRGGVGVSRFSKLVNDVLDEYYPEWDSGDIEAYGDPSAFFGGDKEGGDLHWAETFKNLTGINLKPAPSNEISIRLDAVSQELDGRIDGNVPEVLVCPKGCKVYRKGMNSAYKYKIDKKGNVDADAKPVKPGGYSDIQDADQYVALGAAGLATVTGKKARRELSKKRSAQRRAGRSGRRGGRSRAKPGFDVFSL